MPWPLKVLIGFVVGFGIILFGRMRDNQKRRTILKILSDVYPKRLYGIDIIKLSEGKLVRGATYAYLEELEGKRYIKSWWGRIDADGSRYRIYVITDAGLAYLKNLPVRHK